jgi:hypothetical protein
MAFNSDFSFRNLTQDEMHEIAGNPSLLNVMKFREEYMKRKEKS